METVDVQPKAIKSRNRQVEFALKLIKVVGFQQALQQCKENQWHGTWVYVQKLGRSTSPYSLS